MNEAKNHSTNKVTRTEEEWLRILGPERYRILRQAGTERAYTGEYNDHYENGAYHCGACGEKLFDSSSKFPAHCGWPAFDRASAKGLITEKLDKSHGMLRTEILCARCNSHLGHVFEDGPTDTGRRYCVNSLSLVFNPGNGKAPIQQQ